MANPPSARPSNQCARHKGRELSSGLFAPSVAAFIKSAREPGAGSVVTSLVMVILVSVLSGPYPALLAMRITPVEAMATEE